MGFDTATIPAIWLGAATLLLCLLLGLAAAAVNWRNAAAGVTLHLLLGCCLALALLWQARAQMAPGLSFQLLGVPLTTLMLGPALALWCTALASLLVVLMQGLPLEAVPWNALLYGAVPVLATDLARRAVAQTLPAHPFVYILGAGFAAAGVVAVATQLAASALAMLVGGRAAALLFGQYAPFVALMGFGEATLSGMLLTLLVVYRPAWVVTFNDSHYFKDRPDS